MEEELLNPEHVDEDVKSSRKQGRLAEVPKLIDAKVGKVKRYTWTSTSIEQFFEGLMQHGKDFPKILEHMQAKQPGANSGLTKDQVRFYYYRKWHKVELMLTDPLDKKTKGCGATIDETTLDNMDIACEEDAQLDSSLDETEEAMNVSPSKVTDSVSEVSTDITQSNENDRSEYPAEKNLELPCPEKGDSRRRDTLVINGARHTLDLVALICYWKLKQKYPVGEQYFTRKLSELVYLGTTTIPGRNKGKRRYQMKVPTCGALRGNPVGTAEKQALPDTADVNCGVTDKCDVPCSTPCCSEPSTVTVELRPLTARTWLKVQASSLNPRIRLQVKASEQISSLVQFLNSRFSFNDSCIHIIAKDSGDICTCKEHNFPPITAPSSGVGDCCSGISLDYLLSDINSKLACSGAIPLCYSVNDSKDDKNRMEDLLKLVSFIRSSAVTHQSTSSPSTPSTGVRRFSGSPTLKKYIRSLPKNKSPLAKYRNMKYQSPRKIKLQFDSPKDLPGSSIEIKPKPNRGVSLPVASSVIATMGVTKGSRKSRNKITPGNHMRHLVPKPLAFLPGTGGGQKSLQERVLEVVTPPGMVTTSNMDSRSALVTPSNMESGTGMAIPVNMESGTGAAIQVNMDSGSGMLTPGNMNSRTGVVIPSNMDSGTGVAIPASMNAGAQALVSVTSKEIEKDIEGALVHNFLSEKQTNVNTNSDIFTSSDTVNEILQGLACEQQDQGLVELTKETYDVLPMFSKALDASMLCKDQLGSECASERPPQITEVPENNYKIVLDEASTDFIAKFKELASTMEKQGSS